MKIRFTALVLVTVMLTSSLAGCIFKEDDDTSTGEVLAVFKFSPTDNIREGDTVAFDASSSTPDDGSLTYRWDFDGDESVDETGKTAKWTFDAPCDYVVTLTISNGVATDTQSKELSVIEATAVSPRAEVTQYAGEEDCEGNSLTEKTHIFVWICEFDKSMTDRDISATTTITLDASDSEAGGSEDYISEYMWDLDLSVDSDNDGIAGNDADLTGRSVDWTDVKPGEYQINLTVKNSAGLTDSDKIKVYVSYLGRWNDFEMGGNTSGSPIELAFDMPVVYDSDSSNTIRKAVGELVYPKQDGDCTPIPNSNNCRAKLDVYAFNEDGDEAANTSTLGEDQRDFGECSDDDDCVHLTLSSYMFTDGDTTYGDGMWELRVRNEKINDLEVSSFTIKLEYK